MTKRKKDHTNKLSKIRKFLKFLVIDLFIKIVSDWSLGWIKELTEIYHQLN